MDRYHESQSSAASQRLVDEHKARVWRNPPQRRHPLLPRPRRTEGHHRLDVNFYYSGNVRRCSYIDAEGEIVRVANSRAYNRWTQTFIENGRVYTEWAPYGEDIAELIARNIAKTDTGRTDGGKRMTIALINLFLIGCAMMFAVLTYFTILWLMWKGVRDGMKRWKEMTEEEQNNFFSLTSFKVVATVLLLELSGHGRVRPFQVMSRGPIAPALAGSPLVGVLRMETHIPVLLP